MGKYFKKARYFWGSYMTYSLAVGRYLKREFVCIIHFIDFI